MFVVGGLYKVVLSKSSQMSEKLRIAGGEKKMWVLERERERERAVSFHCNTFKNSRAEKYVWGLVKMWARLLKFKKRKGGYVTAIIINLKHGNNGRCWCVLLVYLYFFPYFRTNFYLTRITTLTYGYVQDVIIFCLEITSLIRLIYKIRRYQYLCIPAYFFFDIYLRLLK